MVALLMQLVREHSHVASRLPVCSPAALRTGSFFGHLASAQEAVGSHAVLGMQAALCGIWRRSYFPNCPPPLAPVCLLCLFRARELRTAPPSAVGGASPALPHAAAAGGIAGAGAAGWPQFATAALPCRRAARAHQMPEEGKVASATAMLGSQGLHSVCPVCCLAWPACCSSCLSCPWYGPLVASVGAAAPKGVYLTAASLPVQHLSVKHAAGQKGVLLVQDMAEPLPRALATSPELEEAIGLHGGSVREGQSASAASAAVNEGVESCEGAGRMAVAAAQAAVDAAAALGGEVAPAVGGQARGGDSVSHAASVAADSNQHRVQDIDVSDRTGGGGAGGDGNGGTPWAVWLRSVQRRVRAAAAAVASSAAADHASWQEALAEGDVAAAAFYSQLDFETPGAAAAAAAVASPASPTPAIVTSASGDCMVVLQQAPAAAQAATGSVFVCHAAAAAHAVVGTSAGLAPEAAAEGGIGSAGLAGIESMLNQQQTAKLQTGLQDEAEDEAASCSSTVSVDGFELVSAM